mmetsp:Transcript_7886/g.21906  ORF Transcript_7886/g.21906 Transcript_7886/m.21906 type:complete len:370 (-) Transcript_7886:979-2088(-)
MTDAGPLQIVEPLQNLVHPVPGLVFREFLSLIEPIEQLAAVAVGHDAVEISIVGEEVEGQHEMRREHGIGGIEGGGRPVAVGQVPLEILHGRYLLDGILGQAVSLLPDVLPAHLLDGASLLRHLPLGHGLLLSAVAVGGVVVIGGQLPSLQHNSIPNAAVDGLAEGPLEEVGPLWGLVFLVVVMVVAGGACISGSSSGASTSTPGKGRVGPRRSSTAAAGHVHVHVASASASIGIIIAHLRIRRGPSGAHAVIAIAITVGHTTAIGIRSPTSTSSTCNHIASSHQITTATAMSTVTNTAAAIAGSDRHGVGRGHAAEEEAAGPGESGPGVVVVNGNSSNSSSASSANGSNRGGGIGMEGGPAADPLSNG